MSKSRDEKAKLTATFLNSMAANAISVGVIAPTVAWATNLGGFRGLTTLLPFTFSALFWGMLGIMMHMIAREILNRLDG
ncbi:MAG: hypothetical protein IOC63_05530 [Methylobacterium sp.]|jgi:hypothetical protein|nr:hypothetical protein [Methylobacterium sp.]